MTTLRKRTTTTATRSALRVMCEQIHALRALEETVSALLHDNPVAQMSRDGDQIKITPTGPGFAMSVMPLYGRIIITCGAYDDDLVAWADAERIITAALAGDLRLVSVYTNEKPFRFAIEQRSGESWAVIGEKTFVRWSFFKPRTTVRYDTYQPALKPSHY